VRSDLVTSFFYLSVAGSPGFYPKSSSGVENGFSRRLPPYSGFFLHRHSDFFGCPVGWLRASLFLPWNVSPGLLHFSFGLVQALVASQKCLDFDVRRSLSRPILMFFSLIYRSFSPPPLAFFFLANYPTFVFLKTNK